MLGVEPDLDELLAPERARIRNKIGEAIRRVIEAAYR
jgi:hypothetical protein